MDLKTLTLCLTLCTCVFHVECLKILGLFPHFGRSHHDVFEPLLVRLANDGHQMTIISHFDIKDPPKNWKFISMGDFSYLHKGHVDLTQFEIPGIFEHFAPVRDVIKVIGTGNMMCDVFTKLPEVKKLIEDQEKFDLIFVEHFNSDCSLGVAHLVNAPVIELQSHTLMTWSFERFSIPSSTAHVPVLFSTFPSRMTFLERVENTVLHHLLNLIYEFYSRRLNMRMLEENLNRTVPCFSEIAKNSSIMLTNIHYTFNGVKLLGPAVVEVGGIHLKKKLNPLDPEMEKFLNESTHGVILFSMGSMIKASSFPADKLAAFTETFAKLKQRVIWKWEADPPAGLSDNVKIVKWAQQMEILHHPKTVAFISHGGLLGTTEALHAGVPMISIPVFGDQYVNAAAGEENGLGVRVMYREITKEKIQNAMKKVLSPEMKNSARSLSEAWRDRPDPLTVAMAEIEHIARHGGHRRRSPARDLSWHQIHLLDVTLFLSAIALLILYISFKAIRCLKCVCLSFFKQKSEATNSSNKRKKQ